MPGVGWLTGRLLSIPDEDHQAEYKMKRKNIYQVLESRRPHLKYTPEDNKSSELSNSSSTSTLRQRVPNSNISKIGTASHISSERFYSTISVDLTQPYTTCMRLVRRHKHPPPLPAGPFLPILSCSNSTPLIEIGQSNWHFHAINITLIPF